MKPTAICIVARRIKRLSLTQQIHHVRALVQKESPQSIRRHELEILLRDLMTKQLKRESRAA
jgi:hypothetical protein